ncbi:MAG: DUF6282 family protein [SAR202 cluster bacterium]|jgi:hypothetical protein|nr:DUF6282 family protein [SAR202 cluster bacterium]MDP6513859.1 DUF6282 family protein [SAR202 cluster bacterium]
MNPQIEEILKGSFDLHVHASPDSGAERRLDALETARYAYEAELAGFVLKSHEYPTTPLAYVLNQMYPGLNVAGAIALNRSVGGLNARAVEVSANLGARVVWMPTFDAHAWMSRAGGGPGITITDDAGRLKSEVGDILDIIKEHEMVLATGHVSPAEAITLLREAMAKGVTRMIATHPGGIATMDEQREMASLGAFIEHTFLSCMPDKARLSVPELVVTLRELGTERCVVTTDFGQWMNPPAAEGMRMAIAALLGAGMEPSEVSPLVKGNPNQLIG